MKIPRRAWGFSSPKELCSLAAGDDRAAGVGADVNRTVARGSTAVAGVAAFKYGADAEVLRRRRRDERRASCTRLANRVSAGSAGRSARKRRGAGGRGTRRILVVRKVNR